MPTIIAVEPLSLLRASVASPPRVLRTEIGAPSAKIKLGEAFQILLVTASPGRGMFDSSTAKCANLKSLVRPVMRALPSSRRPS